MSQLFAPVMRPERGQRIALKSSDDRGLPKIGDRSLAGARAVSLGVSVATSMMSASGRMTASVTPGAMIRDMARSAMLCTVAAHAKNSERSSPGKSPAVKTTGIKAVGISAPGDGDRHYTGFWSERQGGRPQRS